MSDVVDFSHTTDYKSFRHISRDRLLNEMLGSTKTGDSRSTWKVLIMDKVTVKIISYSCKMADITDAGISLVEDLFKRRQPLPSMEAVYFIQPLKENIVMFLSDMSGRCPLYKKAYVFFSSPVSKDFVSNIKNDTSVLPRIGALREMNLEYFPIDNLGYITDNEWALEVLFGENLEASRKFDVCLNTMAVRVATVFASMKELPRIRYRAATVETSMTLRDLIPTKFANALWNCLEKYKSSIPQFPKSETCELLIVDRSVDQIAPVIHEWTYDAMCHDLLNMDGNKYVYEVMTQGKTENKEVLFEDHDPIWLELRDLHFAEASERLHVKMQNFLSKNKAAQIRHNSRDGSDLSTRDLQKMVQALPQYSEQMDKLTSHVHIAQKLNEKVRELGLQEVGQLEEDLVFGQAGPKEVIQFLRTKQDINPEIKLRLLMMYAVIYPEKFEGDKGVQLMQLAHLSTEDMKAVTNMRLLGGPDAKRSSGSFSLKFDVNKKHAVRKEKATEQEAWQLSKFYPMIEELIRQLSKGELPKNEFPCINDPNKTDQGSHVAPARTTQAQPGHSIRSRRTATWAKPRLSDDGFSSDSILRHASTDFKRMGQPIFVFIIGGATRSELRAAHKLTNELNREIILGSSHLDDPPQFVTKLKLLSAQELSLGALQF